MESPSTNGSDRVLWLAACAGDVAAWRMLYSAHFDHVAGYARWRCGGLADLTDDVIQDTWLTAVRRLSTFDPKRGSFRQWLFGIASNATRNAIRSRRRYCNRVRVLEAGAEHAIPTEDHTKSETAERVAVALAELPEHYEAVLRAKYLDHQSVDQIATERGDSAKAIESLLTRARAAFRTAYEKASHE